MAADYQLIVGTHKTCVPSATGAIPGELVAFPVGSVFAWTASDPAITFSDPASASPDITATAPVTGATVTMTVQEAGFTHNASHTVDAVAAAVDSIGSVNFTIQ